MRFVRIGMTLAAAFTMAGTAHAADNAMKVCGAKYQAAKANKTLPAGQTWNQYLASCRGSMPKTAAAVSAAPAAKPVAAAAAKAPAVTAKPVKAGQSAAQMAAHQRMQQCAAQWHIDKQAGKIPAGQTWPKYWSACNTRLKG